MTHKDEVIKESKSNREITLAHRVYRGISRKISPYIAKKTSLSPNQITVISFLFVALGSMFIGFGTYFKALFGAILIQIGSILDFVDGDVARIKNMSSPYGNWLDCILDRAGDVFILGGLIIGVINNPVYISSWFESLGISEYTIPIILGIGIILVGLRFAVDSTYAFTMLYTPNSSKIYHDTKKNTILMEFVFSRVSFITFFIFFAALFGILPIYFIGLTLYLMLWYPTLILYLIFKVRKNQG